MQVLGSGTNYRSGQPRFFRDLCWCGQSLFLSHQIPPSKLPGKGCPESDKHLNHDVNFKADRSLASHLLLTTAEQLNHSGAWGLIGEAVVNESEQPTA